MKAFGTEAGEVKRTPAPATGRSEEGMLAPLTEVEAGRLERIALQFADPRVLTAINVELDGAIGIASVVWAERTPADLTRVAFAAFRMDAARLDVALFCRYQSDQERPS